MTTATTITFDDLVEATPTSTLMGRLIVNLIGSTGSGNGRCLISDNLPRLMAPLTIDESPYTVGAYRVSRVHGQLQLSAEVQGEAAQTLVIEGPSMTCTAHGSEEVQRLQTRPDPKAYLTRLYGNRMSVRELNTVFLILDTFAAGTTDGTLIFRPGQIAWQTDPTRTPIHFPS